MAGFSVGEFAALVSAGALSLQAGGFHQLQVVFGVVPVTGIMISAVTALKFLCSDFNSRILN